MFARLIARVFGTQTLTPNRNALRFRPRVEGMEDRWTPANLNWTGLGSGTSWQTAANWNPAQIPTSLDNLYFTGGDAAANKDCTDLGMATTPPLPGEEGGSGGFPSISAINSLNIIGIYTGTVTLAATMFMETFEFTSTTAALAQPDHHDLVTQDLVWTGGTLNSSATLANVFVRGGAFTATPPAQGTGTLTTGSTIIFQTRNTGSGLVGTFGTFNPGTVQFNNNSGFTVDAGCVAELRPTGYWVGDVRLERSAGGTGVVTVSGALQIKEGGGEVFARTDMPIKVEGGDVKIPAAATLAASGPGVVAGQPVTSGSLTMTAGKVYIETGGKLRVENSMLMTGGSLLSRMAGIPASRTATLAGDLIVTGGSIGHQFDAVVQSGVQCVLRVTGKVNWSGGEYVPVITGEGGTSTMWSIQGVLTVGDQAKVHPIKTFWPGTPPQGTWWLVITTDGGATGTPGLIAPGMSLDPLANPNVLGFRLVQN